MWEEVLSWRLTRSRVLSVEAGALVMAANLASPRFADAFVFWHCSGISFKWTL